MAQNLLRRVSFDNADNVKQVLEEDGCCIVTGFTSLDDLDAVNAELKPYLEGWKAKRVETDIFPPETRWCTRVFGRSRTARENWMGMPVLRKVVDHFLTCTHTTWEGDSGEKKVFETKPILSLGSILDIGPGAKQQPLHRDDDLYYNKHQDCTQTGYRKQSDVVMAFLIPAVPTTYENGATLCIPKSHLWDDERAPTMEEVQYATMQPGEAFCLLGSCWHAGGANKTANERRPMHTFFFTRGINRQEENPYLAYSRDEVLSWSPDAQDLAGFRTSFPNVGHIDFMHPIDHFKTMS